MVVSQIGPYFPFSGVVGICVLAALPPYCDYLVARAQAPLPPNESRALDISVWTIWTLSYVILFWPTCGKLLVTMTAVLLPERTQGWHVNAVGLLVGLPSLVIFSVRNFLFLRVRQGLDIFLVLVLDVLVMLGTYLLEYSPVRAQRRRRAA